MLLLLVKFDKTAVKWSMEIEMDTWLKTSLHAIYVYIFPPFTSGITQLETRAA
jgi:hypothetical protein